MSIRFTSLLLICLFALSACTSQAINTATPTAVPSLDNTLPTSSGDYKYISARIVSEANGAKPAPGEKILLVVLERADGGDIDLATFQTAIHEVPEGVYILGDDDSKTISTMGGWVGEDFSLGFRVPEGLKTYELHWPGANPLVIEPE